MVAPTNDDQLNRVIDALTDPRWDYRTIAGISRETGLSEDDIAHALGTLGDRVRQAAIPDSQGRRLFTLSTRPEPGWERLARLRNFLAKSST